MIKEDRNNREPELEMFTLLNPEFYGMTEGQFSGVNKRGYQVEGNDNEENKL